MAKRKNRPAKDAPSVGVRRNNICPKCGSKVSGSNVDMITGLVVVVEHLWKSHICVLTVTDVEALAEEN